MDVSWWQFAIIALGGYRVTRLLGWDDFPPVLRARERLLGTRWFYDRRHNPPQPVRVAHRRPLLAKLLHCPFCLGFWVALVSFGLFVPFPHAVTLALTPWALAAAIGLVAKNLDP